jgi:hypothetical protein
LLYACDLHQAEVVFGVLDSLLRSGLIEAEESEFIRHLNRFTHPQHESKHFDSAALSGDLALCV